MSDSNRIWTVFQPDGLEVWRTELQLLWRNRPVSKRITRENRLRRSIWPDLVHFLGHHKEAIGMLHEA
jgi:hypothetical protein